MHLRFSLTCTAGVDESMVVTMKFSRGRLAVCTCTIAVDLPNEAVVFGTKGTIRVSAIFRCGLWLILSWIVSGQILVTFHVFKQVPVHMWCPTSLIVSGNETQYPVPEPYLPLNFINSTGMRYEAEEVRQCLIKGEDRIYMIIRLLINKL